MSASAVDEFGRSKDFAASEEIRMEEEARLRDKLLSRRQKESSSDRHGERDDSRSSHHGHHRQNGHDERREGGPDKRRHHASDNPLTRDDQRRQDDARHCGRGNVDYASSELQPGSIYQGRVVRMESYGAFVQLYDARNAVGLIHISQLVAGRRVERVEDVVHMNQEVFVVVLEMEGNNRIRLSMAGISQETGTMDAAQQQQQQDMTRNHNRPGNDRRDGGRYGGGPATSLEQRAKQRQENMRRCEVSWTDERVTDEIPYLRQLWSKSPEPPAAVASKKESLPKRKRSRSPDSESSDSDSDSSSSDDSRRRSRSKRSRKSRSSSNRRTSKRSSRRRRRSYSTSSSSSETSSSSSSESSSSASASVKSTQSKDKTRVDAAIPTPTEIPRDVQEFKAAVQGKAHADSSDDDDDDGPQPLPQSNAALQTGNAGSSAPYGKALLKGEGQAIAQFVQQNLRVPRRGEIGVSQDEIEKFEHSGYVMSGSRHAKMNAVRLRKENQVYSAEEQRALALITMEENQQKEAALMEDFRRKLKEKQLAREAKR